MTSDPPYLYLTTHGRVTRRQHEIEIWFVAHAGAYYVVSGGRENADWVKNIRVEPQVLIRVGARNAPPLPCLARVIPEGSEAALTAAVSELMNAKYGWSDGLIVEIKPF